MVVVLRQGVEWLALRGLDLSGVSHGVGGQKMHGW
jgi:hypothetical protein